MYESRAALVFEASEAVAEPFPRMAAKAVKRSRPENGTPRML